MSTIPLGRPSTPGDVANACCYLASDEGNFITGVNLEVFQDTLGCQFTELLMYGVPRLMVAVVCDIFCTKSKSIPESNPYSSFVMHILIRILCDNDLFKSLVLGIFALDCATI